MGLDAPVRLAWGGVQRRSIAPERYIRDVVQGNEPYCDEVDVSARSTDVSFDVGGKGRTIWGEDLPLDVWRAKSATR
jgi:hypothetical protein